MTLREGETERQTEREKERERDPTEQTGSVLCSSKHKHIYELKVCFRLYYKVGFHMAAEVQSWDDSGSQDEKINTVY